MWSLPTINNVKFAETTKQGEELDPATN
jgi:hypothetical protein